MKKIIFISLLIIFLSKKKEVEFGKEISFDQDNNKFELTSQDGGVLFIYVTFGIKDYLVFHWSCTSDKIEVNPPGIAVVFPFRQGNTCVITLEYKSSSIEKGMIWMNPSTKEIKVKLNQIYEWKYDFHWYWEYKEIVVENVPLIYSIENAEKDAILEFEYNNKQKIGFNYFTPNPMKICHGDQCMTKINTYEVKKGESYKIYIYICNEYEGAGKYDIKSYEHYYLPFYSFHFIYDGKETEEEEEEEEGEKKEEKKAEKKEEKSHRNKKITDSNKYIIYYIILGILLIGGIILCIILICRKNKKSNIKKDKEDKENILFELYNI